ncbi:MAG: alpha/beta hydrolase [Bacteroidales bacterium]|nr:alpha/beta hydrolase [Bacteroidales bacterium]
MKFVTKILQVVLWTLSFQQSFGQVEKEQVAGSWLGTLNAGNIELRLVFNISVAGEASFEATLDSPDQGAMGIPLGEVSVIGDSLRIEAPMIKGYFVGKFTTSSTIEGEWNQAGRSFVLNLDKQAGVFVLNRPQEPQPPFPYKEEEVSFKQKAQDFSLGGTLTVPAGQGPFPVVVLVTGSGSQNRDEEIFGHKPFKVIADHLSGNGIAVLRYDDRGVASSGGSTTGSTTADHAVDARSAIEYLFTRNEIDKSRIGVIGHSEGGMIAFMLASEYDDLAFIISLAGPGVDGKTILLEQSDYISRMSGVDESVLEDNKIVMSKVYELMITNESHQSWGEEVIEFTSAYYSNKEMDNYSQEDIEQSKLDLLGSIPASSYDWMRYFVMFDPSSEFGSIKCPVLALNGGKDCQVLPDKNINTIKKGLQSSGNSEVTAMILPGLNHLFQNCETGLPAEYSQIEETFDPNTLELMSDWIKQLK